MAPHILNIMVVNGQLYELVTLSLGTEPLIPIGEDMDGHQNWSGHGGKDKRPFSCPKSNPGHPVHSLVTILTEPLWLLIACK